MNMSAGSRQVAVEMLLSERLRAALEAHLSFWPFDLRPRSGGGASLDVSALHPFVVRRFELDAVGCRRECDRIIVEFVARAALCDVLIARGFHPVFGAWIPDLDEAHALHLGTPVQTPEVRATPRLAVVAGKDHVVPARPGDSVLSAYSESSGPARELWCCSGGTVRPPDGSSA